MIGILVAGAVGLAFTLFTTPLFAKLFHRLKWGQFIREDGPKDHYSKRGTATMGGIVFTIGTVLGYFVACLVTWDRPTASGLLVLGMMVGLAAIGFIDDFMKVRRKQSLGLGGWSKIAGQVVVAGAFAVLGLMFVNQSGVRPISSSISFIRDLPIDFMVLGPIIGTILLVIWIVLITTATSNAVNVTDGLDGLATGASIISIGSFGVIAYWQFNQMCGSPRVATAVEGACYDVYSPLDVAFVVAAIVGSLIGFLWWNTSPAQIFMGDTGSLGLGGALAALAIITRTELLLVFIGGLFVITTGSVIVQRIYFKLTRGKRIFLMSPIHHHFELKGWAEVTIVVRFWIIAGIFAAIGLGLFYAEWWALS
ncbi:MAG: phospho-N-acetylmuramoyl-pentapeptide-transferase [Pseudoclavibacter sp.]